jgi:hypothetical protein
MGDARRGRTRESRLRRGTRRGSKSVVRKVFWTVVVLIPVVGPLFYAGLSDIPPRQAEDLQAPRTSGDDAGPHGP